MSGIEADEAVLAPWNFTLITLSPLYTRMEELPLQQILYEWNLNWFVDECVVSKNLSARRITHERSREQAIRPQHLAKQTLESFLASLGWASE